MLYPLTAVVLIKLPYHVEENGDLVVMEQSAHVPFVIARVFIVRAPATAIRGQHAHMACSQFFTCPTGHVEVLCDDGQETATYRLDQPNIGLLIPPSIWAQQTYMLPGSVLTVLCDRHYESLDYIRDYDKFKEYRKSGK